MWEFSDFISEEGLIDIRLKEVVPLDQIIKSFLTCPCFSSRTGSKIFLLDQEFITMVRGYFHLVKPPMAIKSLLPWKGGYFR
jgi:hypothetical protein